MLDEHGRLKWRKQRVPDVVERERQKPSAAGPEEAGFDEQSLARRWRALRRRHRLAIVGAASIAVAVAAVAALLWAGFVWPPSDSGSQKTIGPRGKAIKPTTSASSEATSGSAASSATAGATGTPEAASAGPSVPARAPFVAYRRDGGVWVATEAGGSAQRVIASAAGVFALSPSGTRLAVVDTASGRLTIADVVTGAKKDVGPASPVPLEWSADSQWLVYARSAGLADEVVRVAAGGYGATVLVHGTGGRFVGGPDVVMAAPPSGAGASPVVAILSDGRTVRIGQKARSVEVIPVATGLYFVDGGVETTPPAIRYVGFDGRGLLTLVAAPAAREHVSFSGLSVSPDGAWLVYAETGDDGYSRMYARRLSGLKTVALRTHRDSYFAGWSADGTELFRIEGNAVQGESTRLTAVHPDATGWRAVVDGAGL